VVLSGGIAELAPAGHAVGLVSVDQFAYGQSGWHSSGTDIPIVSRSVHVESPPMTSKNQQLTLYAILGWKQAGLETIKKNP
jgi:hypothetical protein